jgi:WD40 repeat protein
MLHHLGERLDESALPDADTLSQWRSKRGRITVRAGSPRIIFLVLASAAGVYYLWSVNWQEAEPARSVETGHRLGARVVAISPEGRWIAAIGNDGVPALCETRRDRVTRFGDDSSPEVSCLRFSHDSSILAIGYDDATVALWEVPGGNLRWKLGGNQGPVHSLAFSPDGTTLASGGEGRTIALWDIPTGRITDSLTGHRGSVNALAFSPNGRMLASGCGSRSVKLWDLADGKSRERPGERSHREGIAAVAFSPDGSLLASAAGGDGIKIWPVAADSRPVILRATSCPILDVMFLPGARALLASSKQGVVDRCDLETMQIRASFRGYKHALSIAFSENGRFFCSGGLDGVVRVLDLKRSLGDAQHTKAVEGRKRL